jgi:hypothetical protein
MSDYDSAAPQKRFCQWAPALLVGASGFCACLLWTAPNWQVFWTGVVPQLEQLWRVPANRLLIVALALKVGAPAPIMALTGMIVWLASLLWSLLKEACALSSDESVQPERPAITSAVPAQVSLPHAEEPASFQHDLARSAERPESAGRPEASCEQGENGSQEAAERPGEEPMEAAEMDRGGATSRASASVGAATPPETAMQPGQEKLGPKLVLTLLGKVTLSLEVPDAPNRPIPVNAKGLHLLVYLAVRRGEAVERDKLLFHVFEWGRSLEEEVGEADHLRSLSMAFERQKKMLRRATRKVIAQVNAEAEQPFLDEQMTPLHNDGNEHWSLAPCCYAVDSEEVEAHNAVIEQARKEGLLVPGTIPSRVKEACERLLTAYKGDFLADLIEKLPQDFQPWEGKASWARRYSTHYRDLYLKALWLSGEYEQQMASRSLSAGPPGTGQRERYARAIEWFRRYALSACETRFDEKVSYDPVSHLYGERIIESERALRRCLALCAVVGDTHGAGEAYATYARHMTSLLRGWRQAWQPSAETQSELERVAGQTGAHRFAGHLSTEMQKGVRTDSTSHE